MGGVGREGKERGGVRGGMDKIGWSGKETLVGRDENGEEKVARQEKLGWLIKSARRRKIVNVALMVKPEKKYIYIGPG